MDMKILEKISDINKTIKKLKKTNKKIIMCHGVFDVLHLGHIKHFEEAKSLGDVLIVSVTSNQYVNKGFDRPYFDLKVRMKALSALEAVDFVIPSNNPTAIQNLNIIKPSFYSKGPDYISKPDITQNLSKEKKILKKFKGKVYFTKGAQYSSSSLINSFESTFDEKQRKFLKKLKLKYSYSSIESLINKISKLKVNVLGEIILDQYIFCEPIGISGKDPFLVFKENEKNKFGGGSFAIAKNTSFFCKKTNLISHLSKKFEKFFVSKLSDNLQLKCVSDESFGGIIKTRYVDSNTNSKIFGLYNVSDNKINLSIEKKIQNILLKLKNVNNNLIISDYGHGLINNNLAKFISNKKFKYTLNAQINSANRGYHGLFKYKNPFSVIINESELRYEFKDKFTSIEKLILKLEKLLSAKNLVVTKGSEGAITYNSKDGFIHCPAFNQKTLDKVGAGDALLAIFSLCKFVGADNDISIFIASLSAANQTKVLNNKTFLKRNDLLKMVSHILK
jgi:rfaE bifunctional protein nucleotidyltransferase chain/domain